MRSDGDFVVLLFCFCLRGEGANEVWRDLMGFWGDGDFIKCRWEVVVVCEVGLGFDEGFCV